MLPYFVGLALAPQHSLFFGNTVLAPGDAGVYYSYIEQGRHGQLFMYDSSTSEPHVATLIQPVWFLLGTLARLTGMTAPAVYALGRALATPVLVWALWWAAGWLWPDRRTARRLALILSIIASGVGWLMSLLFFHHGLSYQWTFPDLWVSEAYTVLTLWGPPHFILVTAGIIGVLVNLERGWLETSWRRVVLAGGIALAVVSVHPFHVLTWILWWAVLTGWRWAQTHRWPGAYVRRWLTVLLMASPALGLYGLQLLFDPITIGRAIQNINITPAPKIFLAGVAGPLIAALVAIGLDVWHWKPIREQRRWVLAGCVAYAFAIYIPLQFQRRLSEGLLVVIAWCAVPALLVAWDHIRRWRGVWRVGITAATVMLLCSSWIVVGYWIVRDYSQDRQSQVHMYYVPKQYQDLAKYLSSHNPRQPVLGTLLEGNIVSGLSAHQFFVGYGVETLRFNQKLALLGSFFHTMSQEEQRTMLSTQHLCYVLDSPRTRAYGLAFHPDTWPDLVPVWSEAPLTLYHWSRCP